jgi:hypothetical protein
MRIVGRMIKGEFYPLELPYGTEAKPDDVVEIGGNRYIVCDDGFARGFYRKEEEQRETADDR